MRRLFLPGTLLAAALAVTPAPAATVRIAHSLGIDVSASNPDNSGFNLLPCAESREETVGGSTIVNAYCNVNVYDGIGGFASGSGQLTLDFDPLLLTGTIAGAIGSINVDLTFVASEVSTTTPYASVEAVPTAPQQLGAFLARAQRGRINGTVTSPSTVPVTATNAYGNAYRYNSMMVTA